MTACSSSMTSHTPSDLVRVRARVRARVRVRVRARARVRVALVDRGGGGGGAEGGLRERNSQMQPQRAW